MFLKGNYDSSRYINGREVTAEFLNSFEEVSGIFVSHVFPMGVGKVTVATENACEEHCASLDFLLCNISQIFRYS
jgi:hypothetical protein